MAMYSPVQLLHAMSPYLTARWASRGLLGVVFHDANYFKLTTLSLTNRKNNGSSTFGPLKKTWQASATSVAMTPFHVAKTVLDTCHIDHLPMSQGMNSSSR